MTHIDPNTHYRVSQVSKLLPGNPAAATIWRWLMTGVGGRRLGSVKIGGRRFVRGQDLLDFIAEEPTSATRPTFRTPAARRRASEQADRELERLGV